MKIAYLFSRYPVPSQTFCDTEIRALETAGHEVEIYSCSAPVTSFRHGEEDWPRAEVLYAPPQNVLEEWERAARADGTWPGEMVAEHEERFGARYDPARRARHALYFADRLRRRGVEHVHVHFANRATHAALFVQALTGVPFSFTAHAQDFLVDLGDDELLRLMCAQAAFVVAVSNWSRGALIEKCPEATGKIQRVYNGLPLGRWPLPVPTNRDSSSPTLRIFSVGRLIEFKGFQDLITACGLLRECEVRFSCEIAGEGPWREILERQASGFDHPHASIRFSGLLSQAEVRARLEACDVFALACRIDEKGACDVLPTVILEAMAAGKPVVSTRLAAVPEMVEHGQSGLLAPPDDPAALADLLKQIARMNLADRRRMGSAGRRRLEREFSDDDSARQLAGLFNGAKVAVTFVQSRSEDHPVAPPLVCLFDRWPFETSSDAAGFLSAENLSKISGHFEDARWMALKAGNFINIEPGILREFDYLPDDLVFETYWRSKPTQAHRLESLRAEVGGACEMETFLLAARRALYLSCRGKQRGETWRHLHAVGPQSLLCASLLRGLGMIEGASFCLPECAGGGVGMAGSTLRRLAPGFSGGWLVGERKLAASLGTEFRGDAPKGEEWACAVAGWAAGGIF